MSMWSLIRSLKNFNVILCFYRYSLRATFYFVWALVFKRYVNIYCTRFLANAACTFGTQANWLPFFGKVCGVPKTCAFYLCDCPVNVYSVFKLKLAIHIQAHSELCSDWSCILQYCGVCRQVQAAYAQDACRLNRLHLPTFRTFWKVREMSGTHESPK